MQDASTASLVWTVTLMAEHPAVLARVRDEQARLRPDPSAPITGERLNEMSFTRQVVKEILRYRPPAPMVPQVGRACSCMGHGPGRQAGWAITGGGGHGHRSEAHAGAGVHPHQHQHGPCHAMAERLSRAERACQENWWSVQGQGQDYARRASTVATDRFSSIHPVSSHAQRLGMHARTCPPWPQIAQKAFKISEDYTAPKGAMIIPSVWSACMQVSTPTSPRWHAC